MPQRQLPTPHPPIGGLVQGFIYPTNQPPVRVQARQQPPACPSVPILGASIATSTDSFLFPVTPPRTTRRSFRIGTKVAVVTGTIRDVTADTILTYTILQPDRQWLERQPVRYRQDVLAPQFSVLAPTISTDFWTSPLPAPLLTPARTQPGPAVPIEGPPVASLPADVFVLNVTPDGVLASYRQRPKPVITLRGIRGPAVPVPQSLVLPAQPGDRWWRRLVPPPLATIPILPGPPTQATYLYPPHQPDRRQWYVSRLAQFTTPGPRTDGAEAQALSLFLLSQPQGWTKERIVSRFLVTPQLLGAFTPPPVAQTSLFPVDQPSRTQWYVPRTPSQQVPAPLALSGATDVRIDPIPPVGGSQHAYAPWRYIIQDTRTSSFPAVIWSAAIVPLPFVLAPADACDTFTVPAEPGLFTVKAELGALFVPAEPGSFTVSAEPGRFTVPGCNE